MSDIKLFPQLTTNRLTLRQINKNDAASIYDLRNDPYVNQHILVPENRKNETGISFINNRLEDFQSNKGLYWAICLKPDSKLIGNICLWNFSEDFKKAELGYSLLKPYSGQGLMTEALAAVLDYTFSNTNFETIEAYTRFQNTSSTNLLTKFGFNIDENQKDAVDENNLIFVKHKPT